MKMKMKMKMKMRKPSRMLVLALMLCLAIPAGLAALAAESGVPQEQTSTQEVVDKSETNRVIAPEIVNQLRMSDPAQYERNAANYQKLLVTLQVHPSIQQEIEKLIVEGYALPEIMIGYEFLYPSFGTMADLRTMVDKRFGGMAWKTIFEAYNRSQPEFIPRAFDSTYLEKLMNTPAISADDIMIADRLSWVTKRPFEEVIGDKQAAAHWQGITAKAGILFSADTLPRVPITTEQMQKWLRQGGFTEKSITDTAVMAYRIGSDVETAMKKIQEGSSHEAMIAEAYEQKYR